MRNDYKKEMIQELTAMIQKENLRVFIAESGTYGFYTNSEGTRIVSFQIDLTISFSGNYKSKSNGTGWRICEGLPNDFTELLKVNSPYEYQRYTTLDEYLKNVSKF